MFDRALRSTEVHDVSVRHDRQLATSNQIFSVEIVGSPQCLAALKRKVSSEARVHTCACSCCRRRLAPSAGDPGAGADGAAPRARDPAAAARGATAPLPAPAAAAAAGQSVRRAATTATTTLIPTSLRFRCRVLRFCAGLSRRILLMPDFEST